MKLPLCLNVLFLIFLFNSSAVARDDLLLNKEVSIIKDFSTKHGYGSCSAAVDKVKSLPNSFKNACKSLLNKAGSATRHCASASNEISCNESILSIDFTELALFARCCVDSTKTRNIGKVDPRLLDRTPSSLRLGTDPNNPKIKFVGGVQITDVQGFQSVGDNYLNSIKNSARVAGLPDPTAGIPKKPGVNYNY